MIKRLVCAALAALLVCTCMLSLVGCKNDRNNFPVTVAGVTIESRPQHVVCLSSEYTEILVNLGYAGVIVGRPYDCTNAEVQNIPSVGTADQPAVELITGLDADLVIADTSTPTQYLEQIHAEGIQILQLIPPTTRTAFSNLYRCLGSAVDGATDGYLTGDNAAKSLLIKMDDVERAVYGENSLNVVIFTDENLTRGITGDSLGSLAIELAGGFNLAIEATNGNIDFEVIATSDPDIILCPSGCEGTVRSMRSLQQSYAIKNNAVYVYDAYKLDSLGMDLVYGTWELARLMHPDLVLPEMMPEGAIDYIPDDSHFVLDDDGFAQYEEEHAGEGEEEGINYDDLFADSGEETAQQ